MANLPFTDYSKEFPARPIPTVATETVNELLEPSGSVGEGPWRSHGLLSSPKGSVAPRPTSLGKISSHRVRVSIASTPSQSVASLGP